MKKVPFEKLTKKSELPKPKVKKEPESLDQNSNRKYDNKIDYNKERDSRTVFIKNLPFETTVDDLWEVFGENNEDTCIECRFITNRETGKHKVQKDCFRKIRDKKCFHESLKTQDKKFSFFYFNALKLRVWRLLSMLQ